MVYFLLLIIRKGYTKVHKRNITPAEIFTPLSFLLMDNPKDAYDYAKGISTSSYKYPSLDIIRCLLLNGREKNIENWDLKFLCAIMQVGKNIVNICQHIDMLEASNTSALDGDLRSNYFMWCEKMAEQEDNFLSTFRLQFFRIFNNLNPNETATVLNSLYTSFYEEVMGESLLRSIETEAGTISTPLKFVLQLVCDGYLCDMKDINAIRQGKMEGITVDIQEYLKGIDSKDIPSNVKGMTNVTSYISRFPGLRRTSDGTYVSRGECLIINQKFANNPKKERTGTEKDEEELIKSMTKIGCKNRIQVETDLTRHGIVRCLKHFCRELDKSKPDFIMIVVLSHGRTNPTTGVDEIMGVDMKFIAINTIKI